MLSPYFNQTLHLVCHPAAMSKTQSMHFVEKIGYVTLKSCDQLVMSFDVLNLFTKVAVIEALSEVHM